MSGEPERSGSIPCSEWQTASQWAEVGLPGIPLSKRGVNLLFRRLGINRSATDLVRARVGRGRGFEYHVSCLPEEAQREFFRRLEAEARLDTIEEAQAPQLPSVSALDAKSRVFMEARAVVIAEIERRTLTGGSFGSELAGFLKDAEACTLPVNIAESVKRAMDNSKRAAPSKATVYNWRKALRDGGNAVALAPKKRQQQSQRDVDALYPWLPIFLRLRGKPSKPSIERVIEKMRDEMTETQQKAWSANLPTSQKARRALRALEGTAGFLRAYEGREGPLQLKARLSFKRRTFEGMDPGTVYTGDGKTFDAEVAHPIHGKPFRPEITTILDAVTRKCVGWSVGLVENAQEVADALRRACEGHGIPAIFYTDRGPGYRNERIDDASLGLCARLGITSTNSIAYNSQARGIIERANGTLWTPLAKEFATYIGKDMDREAARIAHKQTRRDIDRFGHSSLLPSWEEFTSAVQAELDRYNERPHSALKIRDAVTGRMRRASPNEYWADFERLGFEPHWLEPGETDDLFRPYEERVCQRGEVRIFNNQYSNPALEPYGGQKVLVGYDMFDGSRVWVRERDVIDGDVTPGPLICVADFWHNKERYYPVSATEAAMEKRARTALKRQDKKRDKTLEEIRPGAFIEHQNSVPMPFSRTPEPEPVDDGHIQDLPEADILQLPLGGPRKRHFVDDYEMAMHMIAHPGEMRPQQRAILVRLFNQPSAREVFELKGGRVDDLRNLLTTTAPPDPEQEAPTGEVS